MGEIDSQAVKKLKLSDSYPENITCTEAWALISKLDLSVRKYKFLKKILIKKNCNILPSYKILLDYKKKNLSVPVENCDLYIKCTLADKLKSFIKSLELPASTLSNKTLHILLKYGGDSCTGGWDYKMKSDNPDIHDNSVFIFAICILKIFADDDLIYDNKIPNSPYSCQPLALVNTKETTLFTKAIFEDFDNQLEDLDGAEFIINGENFTIDAIAFPSMCDGKVVNSLESISWSHLCFMCDIGGKSLNTISREEAYGTIQPHRMNYSIGPLHLLIRACEFILHISYKINIDESEPDPKAAEKERASRIKNQIFSLEGLHVDVPSIKFGRSTDGNMARYLSCLKNISLQISELLSPCYFHI